MKGLRLSHEIACLVSTWTPLRSPLRTIISNSTRPSLRNQSTLLPAPTFLPILSNSSPLIVTATESIFETSNEEYDRVGPSKLDHPPIPRTSQQAILSLLQAKDYAAAHSLLLEYHNTGTMVTPHAEFAEHAERLLSSDINSNWMEWWKLVPPVALSENTTINYDRFLKIEKKSNRRASRMLNLLLMEPGELDRLAEFGTIALKNGCIRGVGRELYSHFAAFGSLEQGENLWKAGLDGLQPCDKPTAQKPGLINFRTNNYRVRARTEYRSGKFMQTRLEIRQQRVRDDAIAFLSQIRSQVIRIHADFGRLEEAIFLLERTEISRINKFTLVELLNDCARGDRFDLYQRAFDVMNQKNGRITRIRNLPKSHKITNSYFARAAEAGKEDHSLSACRDSFIISRDANYKDPLGEVELGKELKHEKLEKAFLDAVGTGSFELAIQELTTLRQANKTPRLETAAQFLTLARDLGYYQVIESLTGVREKSGRWQRTFWTSATMMSFIKTGEFIEAINIYRRVFDVDSLPAVISTAVYQVLVAAKISNEVGGVAKMKSFAIDSHTFTILLEALVPLLSSTNSANVGIDHVIQAISSYSTIPKENRASSAETDPKPFITTTYAFTPLLEGLFRAGREPIELINLLLRISELKLEITKQQWGIVLASFSSLGHSTELFYLLDRLEKLPSSTPPRNFELIEKLDKLEMPLVGPDRIAYTSILAGLARRRDFGTARLLQQRLVGRSIEEDHKMREVMRLLDSWEAGKRG